MKKYLMIWAAALLFMPLTGCSSDDEHEEIEEEFVLDYPQQWEMVSTERDGQTYPIDPSSAIYLFFKNPTDCIYWAQDRNDEDMHWSLPMNYYAKNGKWYAYMDNGNIIYDPASDSFIHTELNGTIEYSADRKTMTISIDSYIEENSMDLGNLEGLKITWKRLK